MKNARSHEWTLNDVILAVYVKEHGISNLGSDVKAIIDQIGSTEASLEMQGRMIVHLVDSEKGLPHSGFALRYAVKKFIKKSEPDLRNYVIRILTKTPNIEDKKNNLTFLMHKKANRQNNAMNKY